MTVMSTSEDISDRADEADTSVFSQQSAASVDTLASSPSSNLGDTSILSKKQIRIAQRQHEKLKKKAKQAEKRKQKNKISKDDYFQKSLEFRAWLSLEKSIDLDNLSPGKSKTYFKKFVKKWNKRQLPKHYYRGTGIWSAASPSTQSVWAMPSPRDVTPGSVSGESLSLAHARGTPDLDESSFATFGKRAGRRVMKEMEKMRLMQLEKEAEENMGPRSPNHVYAEPITPVVRRALAHGYDVPDLDVKIDRRDYDSPICPRPRCLPADQRDKLKTSSRSPLTAIPGKTGVKKSKLTPVRVPIVEVAEFPSPPPPPPPTVDGDEVFTSPAVEALPSPPPPLALPACNTFKTPAVPPTPPPKPARLLEVFGPILMPPRTPPKPAAKKPPPVPKRSATTRPVSVHVMDTGASQTPVSPEAVNAPPVPAPRGVVTPIVVRQPRCCSENAAGPQVIRRPSTRSRPLSGNYLNIVGQSTLSLRSSSSGSSVSSFSSVSSIGSDGSHDVPSIRKRRLPKQDSYCERVESASYVVFETLRRGKQSRLEKRAMTPDKKDNGPHYDTPRVPAVPVKNKAPPPPPPQSTPQTTVTNGVYSEGLQLPLTPGTSAKPSLL